MNTPALQPRVCQGCGALLPPGPVDAWCSRECVSASIRRTNAAQRRAQIDRARALNASVPPGPDGADHGDDLGPAAQARSTSIERVGGTLRGAGQRKATPSYARRVDASTLFERMNNAGQLSDRQTRAGMIILRLARMAGLERRTTAKLPVVPVAGPDDDERDETEPLVPDGYDAATWHRYLLRRLAPQTATLIVAACEWSPERQVGHPGVRHLATFQVGLTRLADLLELPKV